MKKVRRHTPFSRYEPLHQEHPCLYALLTAANHFLNYIKSSASDGNLSPKRFQSVCAKMLMRDVNKRMIFPTCKKALAWDALFLDFVE